MFHCFAFLPADLWCHVLLRLRSRAARRRVRRCIYRQQRLLFRHRVDREHSVLCRRRQGREKQRADVNCTEYTRRSAVVVGLRTFVFCRLEATCLRNSWSKRRTVRSIVGLCLYWMGIFYCSCGMFSDCDVPFVFSCMHCARCMEGEFCTWRISSLLRFSTVYSNELYWMKFRFCTDCLLLL